MNHFCQRCSERGITQTDTRLLQRGIAWAIVNKRDDLVERVMNLRDGVFWRFRCPDGIFYAVTQQDDPWPRTVLTQAMMRKKKFARRAKLRGIARGQ